jgi:hypothetical protein
VGADIDGLEGDRDEEFDSVPGLEPAKGFRIVSSKAGFTTVVAVDFGPDGLLYALELSDGAGNPTPGLGKVVRVNDRARLRRL